MGTISGTGSLTFDSFAGPIIATGVASTTSLVVALIIHFCKNKKVGPENGDSEQILPQEENKDGVNEERQGQEGDRGRGMHEQLKTVMRSGSLVIYRGENLARGYQAQQDFSSVQLVINLARAQLFLSCRFQHIILSLGVYWFKPGWPNSFIYCIYI